MTFYEAVFISLTAPYMQDQICGDSTGRSLIRTLFLCLHSHVILAGISAKFLILSYTNARSILSLILYLDMQLWLLK